MEAKEVKLFDPADHLMTQEEDGLDYLIYDTGSPNRSKTNNDLTHTHYPSSPRHISKNPSVSILARAKHAPAISYF